MSLLLFWRARISAPFVLDWDVYGRNIGEARTAADSAALLVDLLSMREDGAGSATDLGLRELVESQAAGYDQSRQTSDATEVVMEDVYPHPGG